MDVIVIGAGPAGLYAAERYAEGGRSVQVLEAGARAGGRAYNEHFHGVEVETGAGVGRWPHDGLLAAWMKKHGEPVAPAPCTLQYWRGTGLVPAPMDVAKEVKAFPTPPHAPFGAWLKDAAGAAYLRSFVFTSSYNDYLNTDAVDVVDNYHMEDVAPTTKTFTVHWTRLVAKVVKALKAQGVRVHLEEPVVQVRRTATGYDVVSELGVYTARRVVLAVPARAAERLAARSGYMHTAALLKQVQAQPFVRAYVRFTGPRNVLERTVEAELVCAGPFRKVIPMDKAKRVYMVAYCDNSHVRFWRRLQRMPKRQALGAVRRALCALFGGEFDLDDLVVYVHAQGTHYYTPLEPPYTTRREFLDALVHVDDGCTLVGEAVALNQGWTDSALATVD